MIAEKLKEATKHAHDAVEKEMYVDEIFNKTLSKQEYGYLININYVFHSLIEQKVFNALSAHVGERLHIHNRIKLPALQADMNAIADFQSVDIEDIDIPHFRNNDEALGAMYVMEGATLGGNVIVKHLKQTPGLSDWPFNYYGIYQDKTGDRWKAFIACINESVADDDACIMGATKAFQLLQSIMLKVKETAAL